MIDKDDPAVAAVITACEEGARGTLTGDEAPFAAGLAPEVLVNSPANRVLPREGVLGAFRAGFIAYTEYDFTLEVAMRRPNGEVLLMGEEVMIPKPPSPVAGKRVTRRFTDIWRPEGDGWLLAVRQATVCKVE